MVYGCHPRRAFRYPRARVERHRLSNVYRAFQPFRLADDFRRGSGMKMVKRMSATLDETRKLAPAAAGRWFASLNKSNGEPPLHVRFATLDFSVSGFSQWHHRADTCAWSRPGASAEPLPTRQMSARFRPHTRLTRQLCNRSIPLRFNFAGCISTPLHSDGRKLARQSGNKSCAPE